MDSHAAAADGLQASLSTAVETWASESLAASKTVDARVASLSGTMEAQLEELHRQLDGQQAALIQLSQAISADAQRTQVTVGEFVKAHCQVRLVLLPATPPFLASYSPPPLACLEGRVADRA